MTAGVVKTFSWLPYVVSTYYIVKLLLIPRFQLYFTDEPLFFVQRDGDKLRPIPNEKWNIAVQDD